MGRKKLPKKTEEGKDRQEQQAQQQVQQPAAGSSQASTNQAVLPPPQTPQQTAPQQFQASSAPPVHEPTLRESTSEDSSQQRTKKNRNKKQKATEQKEGNVSSDQPDRQLPQQLSTIKSHAESSPLVYGAPKGKTWQGKSQDTPVAQVLGSEQEKRPRDIQPFRSDQERSTTESQEQGKSTWQGRGQQQSVGDRDPQQHRGGQGRGQQRPQSTQEANEPRRQQREMPQHSRGSQDSVPEQFRSDQGRGSQQLRGDHDRGMQQIRSDQRRPVHEIRGQGITPTQETHYQQHRGGQDRRPQTQDPGSSFQQSSGDQGRGSQQYRSEQDRGQQGRNVGGRGWQTRESQQPPGFQKPPEHQESGRPGVWQKPPGRQPEIVQQVQQHPTSTQPIQRSPQPHVQQRTPSAQDQPRSPMHIPKSAPTTESAGFELAIPQRKKLNSAGTAGRRIRIETNHLALTLKNLKTAIHYDVTLEPDTPKKLLRVAMEAFRRVYYPNRHPAFDGKKNMYSSSELPVSDPFTGEVVVKDDDREKKYKITIKFASAVDLSAVNKFFEAVTTNRHLVTPQEAVQCLDIVLRSAPSLNCIPVGRSFFTQPGRIIELGDGMEMYYGFYQSAILGWKPFLNVDVSHKAFPKCNKVLDLIMELCPRCNLQGPLNPYDRETVDKFMRTLKVQYEIPNNPATKRIMRVNQLDKPASEARFQTDNGQQLTVQQYFEVEKRYRLKYPHLPCLWVGSKQREQKILLPLELCTIIPGQVTNRAMTPLQTSNMIKVAATSTSERKNKIMQSVRQARYNDDPSVREFGFSVSHDFAQIEARVLDSPMLRYHNRQEKPRKGVWRAQTFLNGIHLNETWAIVSVDDRTNINGLREFTNMLIQSGKDVGMNICAPKFEKCVRLPYRKEKEELERLFMDCRGLLLVIVIIPTDSKDVYNYVKQVAELRVGTLTQCIKGRNVFRPKPATVGNILLKINAKLNGVNHSLLVRPRCLEKPCMIMGADVTHPSPESRGTVPSVAAVTASHDSQAFQYNICWRLQPPTQEIIADLENIVREHLLFFYTKNRQMKPERIIFFRDGVSEGQFESVLNAEVSTIRRACSKMGDAGTYKPKITFLVVQKRHHTRFFPTNPADSEDRNMNVPAGTVVDTEITHPTALDFYLVSHASIQGVARPTKYRMLWDDNDMNEDELEQLTYHLCHLFTRCTRSVSYPAPTYYAHLAAARAKVYCERRTINMDALEREFAQLTIKEDVLKKLPMFFV